MLPHSTASALPEMVPAAGQQSPDPCLEVDGADLQIAQAGTSSLEAAMHHPCSPVESVPESSAVQASVPGSAAAPGTCEDVVESPGAATCEALADVAGDTAPPVSMLEDPEEEPEEDQAQLLANAAPPARPEPVAPHVLEGCVPAAAVHGLGCAPDVCHPLTLAAPDNDTQVSTPRPLWSAGR